MVESGEFFDDIILVIPFALCSFNHRNILIGTCLLVKITVNGEHRTFDANQDVFVVLAEYISPPGIQDQRNLDIMPSL